MLLCGRTGIAGAARLSSARERCTFDGHRLEADVAAALERRSAWRYRYRDSVAIACRYPSVTPDTVY